MQYNIPAGTHIGHVHLKVADLDKSLSFYEGLLGFTIMQRFGAQAVFLSDGAYHHHIALNTWQSKDAGPAPIKGVGLYHAAIVYPTRKDLAIILKRLMQAGYPFTGYADHGVSEALYLNDPDGNGIELYWDKPKKLWPFDGSGKLSMYSDALNLDDLLALAGD